MNLKRLVLTCLSVFMCIGEVFPISISATEEVNLIKNPSFQDSDVDGVADDWHYWHSNVSEQANILLENDNLHFLSNEQNATVYQSIQNIQSEKTYQLSLNYKIENYVKGAFYVRYQFLNDNVNIGTKVEDLKVQGKREWNIYESTIQIPKEANGLKIELAVGSPATLDAYVNQISLVEKDGISNDNLLKNPAYKTYDGSTIIGWNYYPENDGSYTTEVKDGIFTGNVKNSKLTIHQTVKLNSEQVNRKYIFTGEVKTDDLSGGYATYRIQLVNSSNQGIGTFETYEKIKNTTDWTPITIDVYAPKISTGAEVKGIKIEQIINTGTGSASFRNPKLIDAGEMEIFPEGDPIDTLVFNGGFERQLGAVPSDWNIWQSTGGIFVSSDRTIMKDGYASVHLKNVKENKNSRGVIHQTISPINEDLQGKSLKISQWIKTNDFKGKGLAIRLQYVTKNGVKIPLTSKTIDIKETQDWTEYTYILDLPKESLSSVKVEYLYDESQGDVWIDNTRVEKYVKVKDILIEPSYALLKSGESVQIKTSLSPMDATIQDLAFESSDPSIVTVDQNGLLKGIKDGNAVISIKHTEGVERTLGVLVTDQSLEIDPIQNVQVKQGESVRGELPKDYTYEILTSPNYGAFFIENQNQFIYNAAKNYFGKDKVTLLAQDKDGRMGIVEIFIEILPINAAPIFENFVIQTIKNKPVSNVISARDPEQEKITFDLQVKPIHGSYIIEENKGTYTPDKDYTGYDRLEIKAKDTFGNEVIAKVTVYIAPEQSELLSNVKNQHPRILADKQTFAHITDLVQTDKNMQKWNKDVIKKADSWLNKKTTPYQLPDGVRLDTTGSKAVVDLAFAYKITKDKKYLNRAWEELDSLCNQYPDWHPEHLLDTAMTANGVAIAYDWLYDDLTSEQKQQVEMALYEKSLKEAKRQYDANHKFVMDKFNWNFVCNTGFAATAIALAHHENAGYKELSGEILQNAYRSIQYGLPQYAPQGESIEGISYWDYGTRYLVSFLSMISTSTLSENEFLQADGIRETALYPIYMSGKAGTYNYSDNDMFDAVGYLNLWFAQAYSDPSLSWYHKYYMAKGNKATIYDMLYYRPEYYTGKTPENLDAGFDRQAVITMRHDFDDINSSFLGFKGGQNGSPHGDMDVGSFVYDLYGERWALDFGKENYNLPGYWENNEGGRRWDYYRKNALGHNTLIIDPESGANQSLGYNGIIEKKLNDKNGGYGIIDMSNAYSKNAIDVKRGFAYFNREQVLIRDEFTLKEKKDVYWQMHTEADVSIAENGKSVILTKNNKQVMLRLFDEGGSNLKFEVMDAKPYDRVPIYIGENENTGVHKIFIKTNVQKGVFNIVLSPVTEKTLGFDIRTLNEWNQYKFLIDNKDESENDIPWTPLEPSKPINPSEPMDPEEPEQPADPSKPANPEEPEQPADPSKPANPEEPEQPADPSKPTNPEEPKQPADPSEPAKPDKSVDSSETTNSKEIGSLNKSAEPLNSIETKQLLELNELSKLTDLFNLNDPQNILNSSNELKKPIENNKSKTEEVPAKTDNSKDEESKKNKVIDHSNNKIWFGFGTLIVLAVLYIIYNYKKKK